ncbi:IS4 family transposase [Chroococcidiopsis thermalis]|uniref:Transposase IS4 family protein n=1 Tax=Chroococcidiopsis thermalis (strain PCC 7203) TaxID=251229 RepID=K9U9M4_CHRTP|nr:IS4 family transposase [Chroococcidiopsis thermalis]AFY91141.1 transposase IS4 family protein [Chroococcidiopsis thermalis PCC 7203]
MLPSLYQTHLEKQLKPTQLLLFNLLINVVQALKEVSIEKIATALPLPILFESRRKQVQRYLSIPFLKIETLWFPIVQTWLSLTFSEKQNLYLVIDRTSWNRINLMLISVIYDKRAIPIYFELLPKIGSSNEREQKRLFSQVLPLFSKYQTIVLGDREFCSIKLANWLREQKVQFCLRLKKDELIEVEQGIWLELDRLGLKPGFSLFLSGIKVTKTHKALGFNLAGKWQRKLSGWNPNEGWFILTTLPDTPSAIKAYKKRFDIEEMFRDFKSGGYNLESTNASGERLISLILIITFAYSMATFKGQRIKLLGVQKYVGRVKEKRRIQRRHSSFYLGLYGQTWIGFIDDCWELVRKLMRLNRNKLKYYFRGIRAMELILNAS